MSETCPIGGTWESVGGAGNKLRSVAEGRADLAIMHFGTSLWDTAAPEALVPAALPTAALVSSLAAAALIPAAAAATVAATLAAALPAAALASAAVRHAAALAFACGQPQYT